MDQGLSDTIDFWFFFFSPPTLKCACNMHAKLGKHLSLIIGRVHIWLAQHLDSFSLKREMSQNVRSLSCTWITPRCHAFASIALMSTVECSRLCFMAVRGHRDRRSRSLLRAPATSLVTTRSDIITLLSLADDISAFFAASWQRMADEPHALLECPANDGLSLFHSRQRWSGKPMMFTAAWILRGLRC